MSNNVFSALSKKAAKKAAPLPAHAAPVLPKQLFSFPAASGSSWGDDEEVPQTTITSLTMPPTPAELADMAAANEADGEDESDSESESEDEEETPVVKKVVTPAPVKKAEPVVQLSKKELKQKELDDLDAALAELGLAPADKKEETTAKKSKKKKAKKPTAATTAAATAAPVVEKTQPVEEAPAVVVDIKSVLAKKGGKKKKEESLAVKKAREEEAKKKAASKSKKDRSTFNEFS